MDLFFSIITVVFNGEKTIEKTINSVLTQSYCNFEYLIIDGLSTDKTLSIINTINDKRIKLLSERDNGIYDAMNKALKIASGDFCIFLGADDQLNDVDVLRFMSKEICKNLNKIYYGNVIRLATKKIYDGEFNKEKFAIKNICHQAIFYPKNIYKSNEYDISYKIFADYVYNLHLFNEMVFVDRIISIFNDTGTSSKKKDKKFRLKYSFLILRYLGFKCFIINIYDRIINHFLFNLINRFILRGKNDKCVYGNI